MEANTRLNNDLPAFEVTAQGLFGHALIGNSFK